MKNIYIVVNNRYPEKPLMAYETRNDAVRAACAIHELPADEAAECIKTVPFMYDVPKTVDLADVQTVIDMTIKAVESVEKRELDGRDA